MQNLIEELFCAYNCAPGPKQSWMKLSCGNLFSVFVKIIIIMFEEKMDV